MPWTPEDKKEYIHKYRESRRHKLAAHQRAYYAENKTEILAKEKAARVANPAKAHLSMGKDARLHKFAAPPWLTAEQWAAMDQLYIEARAAGLVVDHIWPYKGDNSCGLHVPYNLQVMTSVENSRKKNMPGDLWLLVWDKSPLCDHELAELYWEERKYKQIVTHRKRAADYYHANKVAILSKIKERNKATKRKEPLPCT